ncbi:MAG: hypothetical protein KDA28_15340, partial [Phycisphaerales bacterium]|nr:hypothetical protein [Phycisphaerales bacterium]
MRATQILAVLAICLPTGACCNLARYFCGPDDSEWVSERFDTPDHAIRTFREAVRRADTSVIARCWSKGFRRRTGLVGSVESAIAWERVQEQFSGVHVLGYAEISARRESPAHGAA